MFVIAYTRGGCFDFAERLPAGVVAIESPALGIREYLEKLRAGQFENRRQEPKSLLPTKSDKK